LIFCVFIVIGAAVQLEAILGIADALIFIMAIPNLVGLYILAPEIKRDLQIYFEEIGAAKASAD
jgi:AGCS family alanine or glycine:cation symporter